MFKILLFFATIFGFAALTIWGITSYLAPDDLAGCTTPDPLIASCAPADAIVAISGGDTPARAEEAIGLYFAGWAPKIVFSGAALDTTGPSNAVAMRRQAITAGVPEADVIVEGTAADTEQNAVRSFALLTDADRLIVVTSPYHQRRAGVEFQKVFGGSVKIVNHPTKTDHLWTKTWYLTTTGWWLAVSETVKTAFVSR